MKQANLPQDEQVNVAGGITDAISPVTYRLMCYDGHTRANDEIAGGRGIDVEQRESSNAAVGQPKRGGRFHSFLNPRTLSGTGVGRGENRTEY